MTINKLVAGNKGDPLNSTGSDVKNSVNALIDAAKAYGGIKLLEPIEGVTLNVTGFYVGSNVGGGQFVYDATKGKDEHNGGTIIAPEAIAAWDGTSGDIATLLDWSGAGVGCFVRVSIGDIDVSVFGAVYNLSDDSSKQISNCLEAASAVGVYAIVSNDLKANISVNNINVRLKGAGTVHAFDRASNVFSASASFNQSVDVSAVVEVTETIAGRTGTNATKITAAGHALAAGSIIKLVSEDLIPTSPSTDLVRNGEWGVVLAVSGDDIYLDRVLEQSYVTGIRIAEISDLSCDVNLKFKSTYGNGTAGAAIFSLKGYLSPSINVSVEDNDGIGAYLAGNYAANGIIKVKNLTDNSGIGAYGYGVSEVGTAKSKLTILQSGFCRHAYTTGKISNSSEIYTYGEPWASTITGKAHGCSAAAWDTHEQGSDITFIDIESHGSRAILQSRTRRTTFINPTGSGNFVAASGLNTESTTMAEVDIVNLRAYNCNKPFNIKDQSGTGNPVRFKLSGDCYVSYKPTTPSAAMDIEAISNIYGNLKMVMLGGTDFNILSNNLGPITVNGSVHLDTSQGACVLPFKTNNDFIIEDGGKVRLVSDGITRLVSSSSSGEASTSNVILSDIEIDQDLSKDDWFQYPFNSQGIKLINSANYTKSSSRIVFTTSTTTDLNTYDALDSVVFVRVVPSAGSLSLTSVSAGKFTGQQMIIENASSTQTLNIPVVTNIKVARDIQPDSTLLLTWEGTYWI